MFNPLIRPKTPEIVYLHDAPSYCKYRTVCNFCILKKEKCDFTEVRIPTPPPEIRK